MPSTTVRITDSARALLRKLAHEEGNSMQTVLEKAIEDYRRRRLLEQTNAAFQQMHEDASQWAEELKERQAWDSTLMDGIDQDKQ